MSMVQCCPWKPSHKVQRTQQQSCVWMGTMFHSGSDLGRLRKNKQITWQTPMETISAVPMPFLSFKPYFERLASVAYAEIYYSDFPLGFTLPAVIASPRSVSALLEIAQVKSSCLRHSSAGAAHIHSPLIKAYKGPALLSQLRTALRVSCSQIFLSHWLRHSIETASQLTSLSAILPPPFPATATVLKSTLR